MNKTVIGWLLAGLMLFSCLLMMAGAIVLGVLWNNTTTELTAAKQTIDEKTKELDDTRTELNGQIATLTTEKDKFKALYTDSICAKTWDFDYSSYDSLQTGISAFVRAQPNVGNINRNNLTYGFLDFQKMWFVDVNYSTSGGQATGALFFAFPDDSATFFGNMACWLDPAGN